MTRQLTLDEYEKIKGYYWVHARKGDFGVSSAWVFSIAKPALPNPLNTKTEWRRPTFEEAQARSKCFAILPVTTHKLIDRYDLGRYRLVYVA